MNGHRRYVWQLASVCTFFVLLAQILIMRKVLEPLGETGVPSLLLSALLSTGLYALLFRALIGIFYRYIWKRLHKDLDLAGDWEMMLVSQDAGTRRSGRLRVVQSADEVKIAGENWENNEDEDLRSRWRSSAAWIDGLTLSFVYTLDRASGESAGKRGMAVLNLDGSSPPRELLGVYYDLSPSRAKGEMRWNRK